MDVCGIVTNNIIEQLEHGIIPWEKPWIGSSCAFNRVTGRKYSLFNQMLLNKPGEYASLKQWNKIGGKIKQGAKSQVVVFWKPAERRKKDDDEDDDADEKEKRKTYPVLQYYRVFHISQVDGVEPLDEDKYPCLDIEDEDAEQVINDYIAREHVGFQEVEHGTESCYSVMTDTVSVPEKKQFIDSGLYYGTAFHELAHSTGHPSRLARISKEHFAPFGSREYAREELVAEISSAAILNMLGMETKRTEENNASYVQNWISALKNDKSCIVNASGRAEKAVDLIMNLGKEKEE